MMNSGIPESPQNGDAYNVKDQNLFYKGKDEKEKSHQKKNPHHIEKSLNIYMDSLVYLWIYTLILCILYYAIHI